MESKRKTTAGLITVALLVFTVVITYVQIWDQDTWWHLKAGQTIANSDSFPKTDLYSHTKYGEEWTNDEWMGDFLLYSVFNKKGAGGLQILVCVFSAFIAFILLQAALRLGADPLLAGPLAAVAVLASRVRLTTRPELFSILFICIFFFLLTRILTSDESIPEQKPGSKRRKSTIDYFMLPVLQVIWVNIHPGAPFALFMIFCAMVACAASLLLNRSDRFSFLPNVSASTMQKIGLVFVATLLASLLNPYGLHGITAPLKFAENRAYLDYITEWASVPFYSMLSLNGPPGHLALPLFILLGLISFAYLLFTKRKLNLFHLFLFLATAYMAFTSRRFIAMFALLSSVMIASQMSTAFSGLKPKNSIYQAAAFLAFLCILCGAYFFGPAGNRFDWGKGVNEKYYPGYAIDFVRNHEFTGNMYNTYSLGGPLIWGLAPEHRVFADGRVPLYGNDFYMDIMIFEMAPSVKRWNEMQKEFGFTFAVVKRDRTAVAASIASGEGNWALVFWDSQVMIYAKAIPEHSPIFDCCAYTMIDPYSALERARQWPELGTDFRKQLVIELQRNLEQSPRSIQAVLALAFISYIEKDYDRSLKMAQYGIDIDPHQARLHGLLAEIYIIRNKKDLALEELRKAAKIMPEYNSRIRELTGK